MGGDSPHLVRACVKEILRLGLGNCFLGTESIREPWLVRRAIDRTGPDRVVFGSDYNLNEPSAFLAVLRATGIGADAMAAVLGGNAAELFG